MKKYCAFFLFSFLLTQTNFAQNYFNFAIAIEGTPKFTVQTQPIESEGYAGLFSYDLGLTFAKPIPRTNIWLHSGLFFSKFADKTRNTLKDSETPSNVWLTDKRYTSQAINIPVGAKFFFSDRTCFMFVQPALEMDFYLQNESHIEYIFNDGTKQTYQTTSKVGEELSFVLGGSLSMGGQVPVGEKMMVSLQLRAAVGLVGTNQFKDGNPLSMGIRTGILRYF